MGIFDRIFGSNSGHTPQPAIKFGRYSDSYRENNNYQAWNEALEEFEKGAYVDAYCSFFRYLQDEDQQNVVFREEQGKVYFDLYQGSMKITGVADRQKLKAEARIARTDSLNVGFMRRLIEKNFELKYSRFALDPDNNLSLVFDTYSLDGSPYKLYYALKEVATHADKQDDLLLEEFKMLRETDDSHREPLPEPEREAKYRFLSEKIKATLREVREGSLDRNQYPEGIAYLLLDLIYKLDYLVKPEGFTMETLERLDRQFFAKDEQSPAEKNRQLEKALEELLARPREDFYKEMYRVRSTFGITIPVPHDRVASFIDTELPKMKWYQEHGHEQIVRAIPGYIVGYCLFNFALPHPDRDFFHLFYQVMEPEFFTELGFSAHYYDPVKRAFDKKSVRRAIQQIQEDHQDRYPRLRPALQQLDFSSIGTFSYTYLQMIKSLDLVRAD